MLKIASFTLSEVGRVESPGTAFSRRPLAVPVMTLMGSFFPAGPSIFVFHTNTSRPVFHRRLAPPVSPPLQAPVPRRPAAPAAGGFAVPDWGSQKFLRFFLPDV